LELIGEIYNKKYIAVLLVEELETRIWTRKLVNNGSMEQLALQEGMDG